MKGSVRNVVLLCEGCRGERYSAVRFRYGIVGAPPSSASARPKLSHQLDPSEANKRAETRSAALYR